MAEVLLFEVSGNSASPKIRASIAPEYGGICARLRFRNSAGWHDLGINVESDLESLRNGRGPFFHCFPYFGRVRQGKMIWNGEEFDLKADWHPFALHGWGRRGKFRVQNSDSSQIVMTLQSADQRYPWPSTLFCQQTHMVIGDTYASSFQATNVGDAATPVGIGFHPIVNRELCGVPGTGKWQFNATSWFPPNPAFPDQPMSLGKEEPLPERLDFSTLRLPPAGLDCSVGGWDGVARIVWEEAKVQLILRTKQARFLHLWNNPVVFPEHFALEPVDSLADSINARADGYGDGGVTILQPGDSTRWEFSCQVIAA